MAERTDGTLLGLHGIAMAKTYLEVRPQAKIIVADKARTIGGSWAEERLYPRLKTNNVLGSYEFSNFPMTAERYGATPGAHIPGRVVHNYLCDVAAHYGIDAMFQPETNVESATLKDDGQWLIKLHKEGHDRETTNVVIAGKIVVATGLTSEPKVPRLPGQDDFQGLLIHSKQLKERGPQLAACKDVVFLGGNKSAWDVCYDAARSGSRVHMVIRPSGGGPSYVWPKSFTYGPWTLSLARMSATRFFMAFDPTPFATKGPFSWWSRFLQQTTIGNKICNYFWTLLDRHIKRLNGYDTHPELQKLKPWTTPFWMGNSLSIHNYETNWFDLVRDGKISVHIAEVASLSDGKVSLSTGEDLDVDALVCCTGWKPRSTMMFESIVVEDPLQDYQETVSIIRKAEADISNRLKYLQTLPRRSANAPPMQKLPATPPVPLSDHLYRFMVPCERRVLENRNLAFIGAHSSIHAVVVAQAQALWITAFFLGRLDHLTASRLDLEAITYDTILHGVYGTMRRPRECGGAAEKYPDLVFDSIPYVDCLLKDLGLRVQRKRSLWDTVFQPHRPSDYQGLVMEWKKKNEVKASEDGTDLGLG
jgi:cation diffusion facilitator CzcD-associated flavoprotein CzcO